uniref:Uncharacterized protein n=1 Tax=Plectus sambesii TaxID=2011161 RepID=A0A914VG91_9BILA
MRESIEASSRLRRIGPSDRTTAEDGSPISKELRRDRVAAVLRLGDVCMTDRRSTPRTLSPARSHTRRSVRNAPLSLPKPNTNLDDCFFSTTLIDQSKRPTFATFPHAPSNNGSSLSKQRLLTHP